MESFALVPVVLPVCPGGLPSPALVSLLRAPVVPAPAPAAVLVAPPEDLVVVAVAVVAAGPLDRELGQQLLWEYLEASSFYVVEVEE